MQIYLLIKNCFSHNIINDTIKKNNKKRNDLQEFLPVSVYVENINEKIKTGNELKHVVSGNWYLLFCGVLLGLPAKMGVKCNVADEEESALGDIFYSKKKHNGSSMSTLT